MHRKDFIAGIKDKLSTNLPLHSKVILYGSQARGDYHEGSDWDILIVVNQDRMSLSENSDITYPLVMYGWQNGEEINPVLYTQKEWESYKNTPFYNSVYKDGILIVE